MIQENVAIGIIPEYFDKYFNIAVNVYLFSPVIAIIVSPLLTSRLLDTYGWRGTLLMVCCINVQSVVLSALVHQHYLSKKKSQEYVRILHTTWTSKQDNDRCKNFALRHMLQNAPKSFSFQLLRALPFIARVILPGITQGYIKSSWMIYVISFALSNGASMRESSIVATWGGVGEAIIRIPLPMLNKYITYRKLMYTTSILMACNLAATTFVHSMFEMSAMSLIYGTAYGIISTEIYVAVKDVTEKDQYLNAVSWYHLAFGFGAIAGGCLTGIILFYIT